jgi:XTP/dITP diphosphohydrolase
MEIVLATGNAHKVHELNQMVRGQSCKFIGLSELNQSVEWDESGEDFRSNALIKAKAVANVTELPVLSDDSGLIVPGLGGSPGVHTARYAGPNATDEQNFRLLLTNMQKLDDRSAFFLCCLCYLAPGQEPQFFEGRLDGSIASSPVGEQGFGYDPVFYLEGRDATLAQLGEFEKNLISHRHHAVQRFFDYLK